MFTALFRPPLAWRSKEWAQRIGALRQLLHERDGEVAELQRLLEARAAEMEAREGEAAQQAQRVAELEARIAELEARIRQLAQQLEAAQRAAQFASIGAGRVQGGRGGLLLRVVAAVAIIPIHTTPCACMRIDVIP